MLKQLLDDNRIFSALVCVLVFIAGGLLYLQSVKQKSRRAVQRTQEIVTQRQTPQTGEVAPQSAPGGHYHPDGTYHVGPHEVERPPSATGETGTPRGVETGVSAGTAIPPASEASATASESKLDPQTQLKVDKLYAEAERLSAEADTWSSKLYAESQELQKRIAAEKAEIAKARAMLSDPNVNKAIYKAFQDALDAKVRATNDETIRLNDLYIQNRERRAEAIRLRGEARALEGKQ